ncbi:MAG: potassium channel family protein [Pirellulales bacterium]|nr:potassium channel family protein [Pirellulales bacterium]
MTIQFLHVFSKGILATSPVLLFLAACIVGIGLAVGRLEKWRPTDSVYFAFITATTVGYGDIRPSHGRSKIASIAIALIGLMFTGIIVAVALFALDSSFTESATN